jgi:erythromycin esterase
VPDDALVAALADAVTPLATTGPSAPLDDLRAADPSFADATVLGLGEATHGTREFVRAKERLLRYLVTERGLRLVALEANVADATALDDYVAGDADDPAAALEPLHDVWRTEELVALLDWLRSFNEGRGPDERVQVAGIDGQSAAGPAATVRDYLADVDPEFLPEIEVALADAAEGLPRGPADDGARRRIATAERAGRAAEARLDARRERYVATAGERAWVHARRCGAALTTAAAYRGAVGEDRAHLAVRDRGMADAVERLLSASPHDRVAVWAHSQHLRADGEFLGLGPDGPTSLGGHLRERFGDDYYALALAFGEGRYTAAPDRGAARRRQFRSFRSDPLPADAFARPLLAVGESPFLLEFDAVAADAVVADWLASGPRLHSVPGIVDVVDDEFMDADPAAAFDGVLFVAESTPSTLLFDAGGGNS